MSEEQIVTVIEPKATEQEIPAKVEPTDDIITVIEPPVTPVIEDLEKETISGSKKWDIFLWAFWFLIGWPIFAFLVFLWIVSEFGWLLHLNEFFIYLVLWGVPILVLILPLIVAKKTWKKYLFQGMLYALIIPLIIILIAFGACVSLLGGAFR